MTQRKPWDLDFDSWIDVQIREAASRGLFDDLAGAGKPQANLREADDPLWWAKQFLRREEVSFLPPAVEVRVRAQKLRGVLASLPSERAVREAAEALNADIRRVNRIAVEGPPTTQAPLDVDALAAAWRAEHRERGGEAGVRGAADRRANARDFGESGDDAGERANALQQGARGAEARAAAGESRKTLRLDASDDALAQTRARRPFLALRPTLRRGR